MTDLQKSLKRAEYDSNLRVQTIRISSTVTVCTAMKVSFQVSIDNKLRKFQKSESGQSVLLFRKYIVISELKKNTEIADML